VTHYSTVSDHDFSDDRPVCLGNFSRNGAGGEGDATAYVRNLFNVPVIAYSGENDRQMQASRIMEKAYAAEGMHLPHIVGPGMGHAVSLGTPVAQLLQTRPA
jgi:hypothetical protein